MSEASDSVRIINTERGQSETPTDQDDGPYQIIPGAWIEVEENPGIRLPILRKFISTPADFTGTFNGHFWRPELYDYRYQQK